ncbi:hypothetical protein JW968_02810 [Candidatus Woesearchaeota archaeon]|nr:hypothetical protein [Candidatus Woesearchaeota archaeon]
MKSKKATKPWAIGLVMLSTVLIGFAQISWKLASSKLEPNLISLILNHHLIVGILLYCAAAAMLIIALKHGELSVLYPVVGMSYVWVSFLSMWLLSEMMTMLKWGGVALILAGVSSIGYGSAGGRK